MGASVLANGLTSKLLSTHILTIRTSLLPCPSHNTHSTGRTQPAEGGGAVSFHWHTLSLKFHLGRGVFVLKMHGLSRETKDLTYPTLEWELGRCPCLLASKGVGRKVVAGLSTNDPTMASMTWPEISWELTLNIDRGFGT